MFEITKIEEYIYEGVVEPSYKKPTREDTNRADYSRKMRGSSVLLNTYSKMSDIPGKHRNNMYIIRKVDRNILVSSMYPGIHQTNAGSWGTLVLIILKSGLLRTTGIIPQLEINLTGSKRTMLLLIMQWIKCSFRKIIK